MTMRVLTRRTRSRISSRGRRNFREFPLDDADDTSVCLATTAAVGPPPLRIGRAHSGRTFAGGFEPGRRFEHVAQARSRAPAHEHYGAAGERAPPRPAGSSLPPRTATLERRSIADLSPRRRMTSRLVRVVGCGRLGVLRPGSGAPRDGSLMGPLAQL